MTQDKTTPLFSRINEEEELHFRKEFSQIEPHLKRLKTWAKSRLYDLRARPIEIYKFDSRIKNINSILSKINDRRKSEETEKSNQEWTKAKNFKQIWELLDDWLGCRIVSLINTDLISIHDSIINNDKIKIINLTIYAENKDRLPEFINNHIESKTLSLFNYIGHRTQNDNQIEIRLSTNGYEGIHYILEPTEDEKNRIFGDTSIPITPKIELQIRTLLQETWGQIQHEAVYKGRLPDSEKSKANSEFSNISSILKVCDQMFSEIVAKKRKENEEKFVLENQNSASNANQSSLSL